MYSFYFISIADMVALSRVFLFFFFDKKKRNTLVPKEKKKNELGEFP